MQLRTDMYGLADGKAPPVSVEVKKGLTGCAWSYSACHPQYSRTAFDLFDETGRTIITQTGSGQDFNVLNLNDKC
jgi:hypothetical protein